MLEKVTLTGRQIGKVGWGSRRAPQNAIKLMRIWGPGTLVARTTSKSTST